jgi:hypothetical protein
MVRIVFSSGVGGRTDRIMRNRSVYWAIAPDFVELDHFQRGTTAPASGHGTVLSAVINAVTTTLPCSGVIAHVGSGAAL